MACQGCIAAVHGPVTSTQGMELRACFLKGTDPLNTPQNLALVPFLSFDNKQSLSFSTDVPQAGLASWETCFLNGARAADSTEETAFVIGKKGRCPRGYTPTA